MVTPYDSESVDRLAFGSADKAARYATERYLGATGLNWWRCDPTLQFLMRYHLSADELAWAEPHLDRMGGLMGGAVSERAEVTDKHPPRLERYDRWGHDVSEVAADDVDGGRPARKKSMHSRSPSTRNLPPTGPAPCSLAPLPSTKGSHTDAHLPRCEPRAPP